MKDPRFSESVIYIVKHDREGAFGLVINRVLTTAPIEEVLAGFGIDEKGGKGEIAIHYGGPVSPRQGFVLHSDDVVRENSTTVNNGLAITSDATIDSRYFFRQRASPVFVNRSAMPAGHPAS